MPLAHPKVEAARAALRALNPEVEIVALQKKLEEKDLLALLAMPMSSSTAPTISPRATRSTAACVRAKKPLVSGAAIRFDAQVAVFDLRKPDAPCYACLYPRRRSRGSAVLDDGRVRAAHRPWSARCRRWRRPSC